jgi:DNA polymerase-3 subunit gamma/tau
MRQSTQVRTLVEIALVRICKLEDLDELPKLIAQLRDGTLPSVPSRPQAAATSASAVAAAAPVTAPVPAVNRRATPVPTTEMSRSAEPPAKKKELDTEPLAVAEAPPISPAPAPARTAAAPLPALTVADFEPAWRQALEEIGGIAVHMAGDYESLQVTGPQQVVVVLRSAYNKEWCERPDARRKLEQTVSRRVGRELRVEFAVTLDPQTPRIDRPPSVQSRLQRMREVEKHPLVREALELFDGEVVRCEEREP